MDTVTSTSAIEKLAFARDVLQEQIDARVAARDAQILEADSFFKARKTKLLAKYVGALGFRILDYKSKEKPMLYLVPLGRLEAEMSKWLAGDCGVMS